METGNGSGFARGGRDHASGAPPGVLTLLLLGLLGSTGRPASAAAQELRLPAPFQDHMVLQRGATAPIWGWSAPGEEVQVQASWPGGVAHATAGPEGRWRLDLPLPEDPGPHSLRLSCGGEAREIHDLLIGEVWLCSGQSNMEMTVGPAPNSAGPVQDWEREAAAAELPEIRFFNVARRVALSPAEDCAGEWTPVHPDTVARCSAAAYFFAREIHRELGRPVGILHASWGGTVAEAWTSPTGLAPLPAFTATLAEVARARREGAPSPEEQRRRWWKALAAADPGIRAGWQLPSCEDHEWREVELPGPWGSHDDGLGDFDGVVWYRRSFDLPAEDGGPLRWTLETGPIDDMDTVWVDGERIGGTERVGFWGRPRSYSLPPALAHPGHHLLALRVVDTGGPGGLGGLPQALRLHGEGAGARDIPLAGPWRMHESLALASLPPYPWPPFPGPNTATALYQGMIAPLRPYALRGVLWYQGESNRPQAHLYRRLFPALIRDWRRAWERPELPFYFVQIAPFAYPGDRGEAAEIREAQRLTAATVPGTGMVVTLDIGDPGNIHPKDKQEVGRRLALLALRRVYGREGIVDSGPLFRSLEREGARLRVRFAYAEGGLRTRDGAAPSHLEIAGEDGVFHPAQGVLDGDDLLAWSAEVPEPIALRYA